jgi:hypothetical protein
VSRFEIGRESFSSWVGLVGLMAFQNIEDGGEHEIFVSDPGLSRAMPLNMSRRGGSFACADAIIIPVIAVI